MLQRFPDGFLRWISSLDNAHTVSIWGVKGNNCFLSTGKTGKKCLHLGSFDDKIKML